MVTVDDKSCPITWTLEPSINKDTLYRILWKDAQTTVAYESLEQVSLRVCIHPYFPVNSALQEMEKKCDINSSNNSTGK